MFILSFYQLVFPHVQVDAWQDSGFARNARIAN